MSLKLLSSIRVTGPRVLSKHRATFVAVASKSTKETVNRQGRASDWREIPGNGLCWNPNNSLVRSGNTQFPTWSIEGDGRELEKVSLRSSRVSPRKSDDPFFQLPFYKGQDYQMGPLWRGWRSRCRAVPKILVSSFATKGRRIACFPCANVAFVAIPQVCWPWTSHT